MNTHFTKTKNQGFTIVELLIVVVVIAVLAAITIVSYNGITTRANKAAAQAAVATFQKKAELYAADGTTGKYPISATDLNDSSKTYFLQGSAYQYVTTPATLTSALSSTNGTSKVAVRKCAAGLALANQGLITQSNITGLEVFFWNYDGTGPTTTPVVIGNAGNGTTDCPEL